MKKYIPTLFVLLAITLLYSCQSTAKMYRENQAQITEVVKSMSSQEAEQHIIIINTQEELITLYNQLNQKQSPGREVPVLDFNTHTIVAVSTGRKATGGYDIDYEVAQDEIGKVQLDFTVKTPSPGQNVTTAITTPMLVMQIDRPSDYVVCRWK